MTCPHAYHDQEASISTDGLCPLCLLAEIERLRAERLAFATESEERKADNERLRAALDRAADALEFYDNKAEAQKARRALEQKP